MTDETQEYVYGIAHPHGYIKIGHSTNPQHRLKNHQTSTPYELWLLAQIPVDDAKAVEAELHERYDDVKVRGEWFELDYDAYDDFVDMVKMEASSKEFESVDDFKAWQRRKQEAML